MIRKEKPGFDTIQMGGKFSLVSLAKLDRLIHTSSLSPSLSFRLYWLLMYHRQTLASSLKVMNTKE